MALAAYVDHEVGRLLDALQSAGLAENTLILFSSDHGRSLNEYGAVEKCVFDDPVWRVPFIWSWPGHLPAGQTRTDLCELIDTTRTLMALAGLDEPDDVRGRDLFGPAPAPEAVFGQIGWPEGKPDRVVPAEAIDRYITSQGQYPRYNSTLRQALRTDRYRMDVEWMARGRRVPREEMDGNLFDLQADPLERTNLFEDPQHAAVVEELLGHLERWYATLDRPAGCFPPE
jgi:arylsulfatase A-like enzyme